MGVRGLREVAWWGVDRHCRLNNCGSVILVCTRSLPFTVVSHKSIRRTAQQVAAVHGDDGSGQSWE